MGHIQLVVPDGHTVQVHPPVAVAPQTGMIGDPAAAGAKAAMDAALPAPAGKKPVAKAAKKAAKKAAGSESAKPKATAKKGK